MSEFTSCSVCKNRMTISKCSTCTHGSNLVDNFEPKPKQKIINLSMMAGSDILVEFKDSTQEYQEIGFLNCIGGQTLRNYYYEDKHLERWLCCRILEDYWHSFKGDKCPLPDGLIIGYSTAGARRWVIHCTNYEQLDWSLIYEFKVYGTADDACYEWQEEKEE